MWLIAPFAQVASFNYGGIYETLQSSDTNYKIIQKL